MNNEREKPTFWQIFHTLIDERTKKYEEIFGNLPINERERILRQIKEEGEILKRLTGKYRMDEKLMEAAIGIYRIHTGLGHEKNRGRVIIFETAYEFEEIDRLTGFVEELVTSGVSLTSFSDVWESFEGYSNGNGN
jgi:hypothetical protein